MLVGGCLKNSLLQQLVVDLSSTKCTSWKWWDITCEIKSQNSDFNLVVSFLLAVLYILEKESEDFASCMFPSGFFVVHDASWGGQHNVSVETQTSLSANAATETQAMGQASLRQVAVLTEHFLNTFVIFLNRIQKGRHVYTFQIIVFQNPQKPRRLSQYLIMSLRSHMSTTLGWN